MKKLITNAAPKKLNRRWAITLLGVVALCLTIGVTSCGRKDESSTAGNSSAQSAPTNRVAFRVALIANGPLSDWGFNQSHRDGLNTVKASLGDRVDVKSIGDIPETGDAERMMRRLIDEGNNLIIAASFGYQDGSVKLAADHPNVKFLQAWGFKPAPNLGTYSAKMYEAWYVMGIVAGKMSKTGKLGIVAAHPIPPMKWQINAYVLGARSVNSNITASVAFINHWFDPGLATEASEALISQGCDVLCGVLDNSVAVAKTAERRGVMLIGHNTDLSSFAPNSCLVGTQWLWGKLYADAIEKMIGGNWKGTDGDLNGGFKEGYVGITKYSSKVPEEVRQLADSTVERIKSGELAIYHGPIKDNKGNVAVAEGKTLSHEQIMGMDWFVEGIK